MFDVRQAIANNYEEYKLYLLNVLKKKFLGTLDIEDIKDIIGDTFIRAIRYQNNFEKRDKNSFRSWLGVLAVHMSLNKISSRKEKDTYSQEDENISWEINELHSSEQKDTVFFAKEVMKFLNSSIPELDRKILLGFINGYTYDELTEIFEVPLGTIKSKIHWTRKKLIKHFKNTCHDYGWNNS